MWRYSGVLLGRLLRPVVSPRFKCPGCQFTWSPGLLLLELLPPSCSGCGSSRCPSCSSHPSPAWFSSKTSASWVLTVASAPDSERAFAFGRFFLLGIQLGLVAFYPGGWLVRRLGSLSPIFSLFLSFGVLSLRDSWTGSWRGSSHRVVSSFSFGVALPLHSLRTFPSGWCLAFAMGSPVSGRVALFCALDRNEGFFHSSILSCFAMGSPCGSCVFFHTLDRNEAYFG